MAKRESPLEDAVRKMLTYRGYAEISVPKGAVSESKTRKFLIGKHQSGKTHPRPDSMCIAMIDLDPTFAGTSTQSSIKIAYGQAITEKADKDSSILYIYSFGETGPRKQSIDRAYQTVLSEMKSFNMTYYLEALPIRFFQIDYSMPRTSRNWLIEKKSVFDIIKGTDGEDIYIDKPPGKFTDDPYIRYIGARHGDYVSFERLDCLQIGPIYSAAMARVRARKDQSKQDLLAPPQASEAKAGDED